MDMQTLMAIVDALRSGKTADRVVYKEGRVARREPAGGGLMQKASNDIGYGKYVRMSSQMGETPVSYEEWMAGR